MRRIVFFFVIGSLCFLPKHAWVEIGERAFHGAGAALFHSVARLSWWGGALYPDSAKKRELLLFSKLCDLCAHHMFCRFVSTKTLRPLVPLSQISWHRYQKLLSEIPIETESDAHLVSFLQNRWLAKANGFYTPEVDWVCPAFGFSIQVHPETTSSYARDPATKSSLTYLHRVSEWKKHLPQPESFPLILMRPVSLEKYLPLRLEVSLDEPLPKTIKRLASLVEKSPFKVVVDWTKALQVDDPRAWLDLWEQYKKSFAAQCDACGVRLDRLVCVQNVTSESMNGLRVLPLSSAQTDLDSRFLCAWVSHLGLSANPLEMDRGIPLATQGSVLAPTVGLPLATNVFFSKERFETILSCFEQKWHSSRPEKNLMVQGALATMKGFVSAVSEEKWRAALHTITRSQVVRLSVAEIEKQLQWLIEEGERAIFFDVAAHVEQMFCHFLALLEIVSPFSHSDFAGIYRERLSCIPEILKPLTACALHSSAMTSVGGILHAAKEAAGQAPRVLYGENTYFECIMVANDLGVASPLAQASLEDLKNADLIFTGFNPVLIRGDDFIEGYRVEKVEEMLYKALGEGRSKPLTLALDSTIDAIDSQRTKHLLSLFQEEIATGRLNIVCFRSGLKFDLFGMDNYAGAPFYMIHNASLYWTPFNALIEEPALQTDRLSVNWFCLAYKDAAPYLEQYRAQIFENTRQVLNQVPQRLFAKDSVYRITPMESGADAAFIDLRVTGSLHPLRAAALVGASIYSDCMQNGHPIFYRRSIGFYHPNFGVLFGKNNSSARITVGLDSSQVDVLVRSFQAIDALNGP